MNPPRLLVAFPVVVFAACAGPAVTNPPPAPIPPAPPSVPASRYTAISLDGLADGIRHYRNKNGYNYPRYAPEQIVEIADNMLLYQRANGGWIEN